MQALVGTIFSIVLSLSMLGGFSTWSHKATTNIVTAFAAAQQVIANKIAYQYVQDNGAAIAAQATATTPVTITAAMLNAAGYLQGFSPTNVFGQAWQVQVLQPTAGTLQTVVQSVGGRPITNTGQLVQIALQVGPQGGFVPYAGQNGDATMNPANAYGAGGSWGPIALTNFTNPGSGHLVSLIAFSGSQSANGYLYRVQVPGHPELNNMQTDLGMTDQGGTQHNISGAQQISAQSIQALTGGSLASPSITTANGTVITWDQVPEGGVLSLKGANGTWVHVESLNGKFRLVNSAWNTELFSVDQAGNVIANGTVKPGVIGAPNTACPQNGASGLNSDGSGQWLQCLNGVLKPIGGNILRYGYYTAQHGSAIPAPNCPAGGTRMIVVTPNNFSVDPTTVVNYGALGAGPWSIYITDGSNTAIAGATATVGTYCGY